MALAFGLDISVSVNKAEYALQRDGLALALLDPAVSDAILSQPGAVMMMAYEWSGSHNQNIVVPWTRIDSEADLTVFTYALNDHVWVEPEYPTAIGRAVGFGLSELRGQRECDRLVLDVSGDGVNNDGYSPEIAYKHFPSEGVTVNGLVVQKDDVSVLNYYLESVILGSTAFVEVAYGFSDYSNAMKRKLLREIQSPQFARK